MYASSISHHLSPVLVPGEIQKLIPIIIRNLQEIDKDWPFDAIAVSGTSGLLLAGLISYELKKNIIVVRKTTENCYSGLLVEGPMDGKYIVFDDLISTGKTIGYIKNEIKKKLCEHSVCVGVYLWNARLTGDEEYQEWIPL